jgi:hypothetical protein
VARLLQVVGEAHGGEAHEHYGAAAHIRAVEGTCCCAVMWPAHTCILQILRLQLHIVSGNYCYMFGVHLYVYIGVHLYVYIGVHLYATRSTRCAVESVLGKMSHTCL